MRTLRLIACFAAVPFLLSAQTEMETDELLPDDGSDEPAIQAVTDELQYLREHPVDLRTANYGDLLRIPFLSPFTAGAILMHRDTVQFVSVEQLKDVRLIAPDLFERIVPYVTVTEAAGDDPFFAPVTAHLRVRRKRSAPLPAGFRNGAYRGTPEALYQRMRVKSGHAEAAMALEKDAGESVRHGHASGYAAFGEAGPVRSFIVGDFSVSAGEGMVLARRNGTTSAMTMQQLRSRAPGLRGVASSAESGALRGAALSLERGAFGGALFLSAKPINATVDSAGDITSPYTSGLFRTDTELRRRRSAFEAAAGGWLTWSPGEEWTFTFSGAALRAGSSDAIRARPLSGSGASHAAGFGWTWRSRGWECSGEGAVNGARKGGWTAAVLLPLASRITWAVQHRSFPAGSGSPLGAPSGRRPNERVAETGDMMALSGRFGPVRLEGVLDRYALSDPAEPFDTRGLDAFCTVEASVNRGVKVNGRMKWRSVSGSGTDGADVAREQIHLRIGYSVRSGGSLTVGQRFERTVVTRVPTGAGGSGVLSSMDARWEPNDVPVAVTSRIVFFDAGSYDSRLYLYESDLPGSVSNPPLYGRGVRWYVLVSALPVRSMTLALRYAETVKPGVTGSGSGSDAVEGPYDRDITLQADFSF